MDSTSDKNKGQLPLEQRTVTQLNSYRPFTERDLEALASSNQVPTSIPSLKSGIISPSTEIKANRIEAITSAKPITENSKPVAEAS